MAIINSSPEFEGSETQKNEFGQIIKEGIRKISFYEDKNKQGNFFFLLPAYKTDSAGRGVWYKVLNTRQDFGLDKKEIYAIPANDPISYFENQCKLHFPEYAKIEEYKQGTQTRKKYPSYGRKTNKVLYNSAYVDDLGAGAHVLTVPGYYVGSAIEQHGRTRDSKGNLNPMLNNYKAAIPVWLQIKKDSGGMPWIIKIDSSNQYVLPDELADSDYLYNLDDVVDYPEIEYLVNKLKEITPSDIFNKCMHGYFDKTIPAGITLATPVVKSEVIPTNTGPASIQIAPAFNIPKVVKAAPTAAPVVHTQTLDSADAAEIPKIQAENTTNPSIGGMTLEQARKFIAARKTAPAT